VVIIHGYSVNNTVAKWE